MTFYIDDECGIDLTIDYEKSLAHICKVIFDIEKCPYDAEISLLLTNNEGIRRYNNEFRNIDKETDVLSFPAISQLAPINFNIEENGLSKIENFNLDTDELILGDIIISNEKIIEQAEAYGNTVEYEFNFMLIHSLLHLFGYDHIVEEDRIVMEAKQKEVLKLVNIA